MSRACTKCERRFMKDHLVHLHELKEGEYFILRRTDRTDLFGCLGKNGMTTCAVTCGETKQAISTRPRGSERKEMSPWTEVERYVPADEDAQLFEEVEDTGEWRWVAWNLYTNEDYVTKAHLLRVDMTHCGTAVDRSAALSWYEGQEAINLRGRCTRCDTAARREDIDRLD